MQAEDMHMRVIVARVDKRIMRMSAAGLHSHCHVRPCMATIRRSFLSSSHLKNATLCSNHHRGISAAFLLWSPSKTAASDTLAAVLCLRASQTCVAG